MVWCRVRSHLVQDENGNQFHFEAVVRQDWTNFRGVGLSTVQLERFCTVTGQDFEWTESERDIRVSEDCWRVLTEDDP